MKRFMNVFVYTVGDANLASQVAGPFDRELISSLPESLKYICHNGAGYDNIDAAACTGRGKSPYIHMHRAIHLLKADLYIQAYVSQIHQLQSITPQPM